MWLLPRRVKTTWRKQLGRQVAIIWYAVSGTIFFTEDINLQKISCRPTKEYNKRCTKWQLVSLEVFCRIDAMLTDDWEGKSLDCGKLKHDLLSTVLREGYKQREATAKLARFRLCAFQWQKEALFPKGIVTTRRRGNRGGQRDIFSNTPRFYTISQQGLFLQPSSFPLSSTVITTVLNRISKHLRTLLDLQLFLWLQTLTVLRNSSIPKFRL
jgi:hypothetical protein